MARAGLKRVMKTVRGKHGTHRRAYYMRAETPKAPSRGRRIAGALAGAAVGAIGGAIFGGAGGAGLGAASAAHGVRNDIQHGLRTHYGTSNVEHLPRSIHTNYAKDYMRHNSSAVAAHAARATAMGGIWGAGAGAAGGAAFGAALGYAAAARLGRGGRAGGLKNDNPRSLGTGSQWTSWTQRPRTSPPGKERANTPTENNLVRAYRERHPRG